MGLLVTEVNVLTSLTESLNVYLDRKRGKFKENDQYFYKIKRVRMDLPFFQ